eukprot:TRINITY_DN8896_c0_g1_i1.p2 TRINITY_DN8896_c0_g1~~TRINITY_DN8896_c0_g1_i1.p2  ORF type:complete len:145 (-),score=13.03 TRINITY_DN8896_c0_g1_i1:512-946(-)
MKIFIFSIILDIDCDAFLLLLTFCTLLPRVSDFVSSSPASPLITKSTSRFSALTSDFETLSDSLAQTDEVQQFGNVISDEHFLNTFLFGDSSNDSWVPTGDWEWNQVCLSASSAVILFSESFSSILRSKSLANEEISFLPRPAL